MLLFIIIPRYQNSFITSNMDDYLEKRRKNRRLLYPKNQYIVIHPQKMRKKSLIFFQLEVENQKLLLL